MVDVYWSLLGSRKRPADRILFDDSNRRSFALAATVVEPIGFASARAFCGVARLAVALAAATSRLQLPNLEAAHLNYREPVETGH